jgi:hypothetical protein
MSMPHEKKTSGTELCRLRTFLKNPAAPMHQSEDSSARLLTPTLNRLAQ